MWLGRVPQRTQGYQDLPRRHQVRTMSFEQCFGDLLAMEGTYANGTMPNRQHTSATPSSRAAFTPNFQNKVPFWITRVEPSHLFPLSKMYRQANLFYAIVYFAHPCSEVRRGPESYAPARDLIVLQLRCHPVLAGGFGPRPNPVTLMSRRHWLL